MTKTNIKNKYFIIEANHINLSLILQNDVIEKDGTYRKSIDNTKIVLKAPINSRTIPNRLINKLAYSHDKILEIINTSDWQVIDNLLAV